MAGESSAADGLNVKIAQELLAKARSEGVSVISGPELSAYLTALVG
ncbi:hypothetical protein [Amycolatopsis pithecellobii]|uniref:Uncharacterized protein n=1 Tax=Amycolatopsis pithecellobii TaxID=664692 RepID=A0A6N7Z1W6_9PSEU|nr:hypothetical protein [Amycolatopsis pithecellobii]MTD53750.1 hypothetical protein [Amycolatopsis pithecellobii]